MKCPHCGKTIELKTKIQLVAAEGNHKPKAVKAKAKARKEKE